MTRRTLLALLVFPDLVAKTCIEMSITILQRQIHITCISSHGYEASQTERKMLKERFPKRKGNNSINLRFKCDLFFIEFPGPPGGLAQIDILLNVS
jgi:hypothetical protein